MLQIEENRGLVRICVGGTLESEDYNRFVTLFEQIADESIEAYS
ncbi:hypothetical protein [Croceibacterium aestuarii]|nr:hypothetical protein [Croceibacterium sp. D39]